MAPHQPLQMTYARGVSVTTDRTFVSPVMPVVVDVEIKDDAMNGGDDDAAMDGVAATNFVAWR